jgi:membrane protein implicated in regulation of membrane protease activity
MALARYLVGIAVGAAIAVGVIAATTVNTFLAAVCLLAVGLLVTVLAFWPWHEPLTRHYPAPTSPRRDAFHDQVEEFGHAIGARRLDP